MKIPALVFLGLISGFGFNMIFWQIRREVKEYQNYLKPIYRYSPPDQNKHRQALIGLIIMAAAIITLTYMITTYIIIML